MLTRSQTYDALGRPDVATDFDGTKTFTTSVYCTPAICTPHGRISVTTQRQGQAAVTSVLDDHGRDIQTITTGTDGRTIAAETEYDRLGRVKSTVKPAYEGATPQRTTKEYDPLDRLIFETAPDGSRTRIVHEGNKRTLTNTLEQTRTEVRNSQEQLVSLADAYGKKTTYHYDAAGKLTSVTDPIQSTITLTYDNLGRCLTINDPDLGFRKSEYDVLGQLIGRHDAAGKIATLRYDVLGRLKERTEPEGVTTWTYDTAVSGVGKLASVSTNGAELEAFDQSYSYDALSRPSVTTTAIGGRTFAITREYDAFSRPSVLTYPSGLKVRNVYSTLGFLARTENAANSALFWRADEYNAAGTVIRSTLGNGVSATLGFNPATDRLETVVSGKQGAAQTQNLKYVWTSIGTLKERHDNRQGLVETFTYDDLNRLTDATIPNRGPLKIKYDDAGNITEKSDVGVYHYGENRGGPHAVSSTDGPPAVRYLYDGKGNQTGRTDGEGRSLAEMRYTSFDKPIFIERDGSRSEFVYGPERDLIVRRDANANPARGGNRTIRYVEGLYEEIIDASTDAVAKRHSVRAGNQTVAIYTEGQNGSASTATTRYPLTDHLGSIDAVTDESGAVAEQNSFDAFGRRRNADWTPAPVATLTSSLDKGFTGHEQLDHLGLVHMGARIYDPVLGRFTSGDPTVPRPDSTQGFNRYTYVDNNPLTQVDPTGYAPIDTRTATRIRQEGSRGGVYYITPVKGGFDVLAPNGSRFFCSGGGQGVSCTEVNPAGNKEGDGPKDFERHNASGESGERSAACSGTGCNEVVAQPLVAIQHPLYVDQQRPEATSQEEQTSVGLPGFGESFIPIWGSGKTSYYYVQTGEYGWAALYAGLAVSDVFMVKAVVVGAARGGLAAVLKGQAGVNAAAADIEAAGGRVLGTEITIEVQNGLRTVRTRPDLFVELPSGQLAFVEVKAGWFARLTRNQKAAFPIIRTQGGIPVGANVDKVLDAALARGVPIGPTPVWVVHY